MGSWSFEVRHAVRLLAGLGLAIPLAAQSIIGPVVPLRPGGGIRPPTPRLYVVDDTPGCRFTGVIQEAIDAAFDGDVVLVKSGVYVQDFVIDRKAVFIFGEAGTGGTDVAFNGRITVRALVRGFYARSSSSMPFTLSNNDGPIWIEACRTSSTSRAVFDAKSSTVGLFHSELKGLNNLSLFATLFAYDSQLVGYPGLSADLHCGGYCFAYDTYWPDCYGDLASPGDPGLQVSTGQAFLFGCTSRGGNGGGGDDEGPCCLHSSCSTSPAPGGSGVYLKVSSTQLTWMDSSLTGGLGLPNGLPIYGSGTNTLLSGPTGGYVIESPVVAGTPATLKFTGPAGWNVFLTYSLDYAPVYVPEFKGYSVVDPSSPTIFVGAMPASGTLTVSLPFLLPSGSAAQVLYSQAKLYDPVDGVPYLAAPSAMLLMRSPCP